jgi:Cys-rich protein (TIGR01571 family)
MLSISPCAFLSCLSSLPYVSQSSPRLLLTFQDYPATCFRATWYHKMHSYDYPKVRPPSSAIERHTSPRAMPTQDRHFSWMQTPIEARGRTLTGDSNIPPLPQVPTHLAGQQTSPVPEPHPAQTQYPPDVKENMYHNQPWRSAVGGQTAPSEPEQQTSVSSAHSPDRYTVPSVGPDENPLITPTTPVRAHTSTNMPVLAPSGPNYSPFSAPTHAVTGGTWTHDLCSCADPTTCMTSIFCPCIIYGKTQYRLTQRADKKDPTNMLGYTAVNGSCTAFGLLCGINGILAAIQHARIRRAYSMDSQAGNVISDCLKGCCCCCCTVAQDEKEVKRREDAAKGTEVQYRAPSGMVFAAPPR